jgi:hypothetical protein
MKTIFAAIFLLWSISVCADQTAITDTGDKIILSSDGTWKYANKPQNAPRAIERNTRRFEAAKDSTFLLKSTRNNSGYLINPAKWSFEKTDAAQAREYRFQLKGKDLYGMAITEGIQIPLENLVEIALSNAQSAAQDAKLIMKEYRVVNGKQIIYMVMDGTLKGIHFTYHGYYYSDSNGSTQLVAYTASNLVQKYKSDMDDFLNGLIIQ